MNVSDLVFKSIAEKGCKHVFVVPGDDPWMHSAIERFCQPVIMRDERAAAFAAQVYGRLQGLGTCVTSHGPGMSNLITGLAAAYLENDPLLTISSQLPVEQQTEYSHAYVSEAILGPVSKNKQQLTSVGKTSSTLCSLLHKMEESPKGPVCLVIPQNISKMVVEDAYSRVHVNTSNSIKNNAALSVPGIAQIIELIESHEKILAIIGAGAIKENGVEDIRLFLDKTKALALTSLQGKGISGQKTEITVSRHNINYITKHLNYDLCLLIGVDIAEGLGAPGNAQKVVSISGNRSQITATTAIQGCLKELFHQMNSQISPKKKWIAPEEIDFQPVHPVEWAASATSEWDGLICIDTGLFKHAWAGFCKARDVNRVIFTNGLSSIGWSLGASIGAHFATGEKVLAVLGDGSLSMSTSELFPILQYDLPVSILLINDRQYGMISRLEQEKLGKSSTIINIANCMHEHLAKAFGFEYHKVTPGSILSVLQNATTRVLLELDVDYSSYVFSHH